MGKKIFTPEEIEKKRIAGRKGGLNKKGKKSKHVIDREKIYEQIKEVGASRAKRLLDVQTILATGGIKIFRIDYDINIKYVGKGESKHAVRERVARKPALVTRETEITAVLDHEYGDGAHTEDPNTETEHFFVVTKDPENKAIDSILDRTFGKATETKKITTGDIEIDEDLEELARLAIRSLVKNGK